MRAQDFQPIMVGEWVLDPLHNTLSYKGQQIKVEKRLIRVLLTLAQAPQQTCSKQELLDAVWTGKEVSDDTLSVAISNLRKIMGCDAKHPVYIETINGYGFRLLPEAGAAAIATAHAPPMRSLFITYSPVLIGLVLIVAALFVWHGSKSLTSASHSAATLLDNDAYQKARFLLQKNSLADLQHAEILLKNLQALQPEQPVLLNDYGKAIFYQAAFLPKPERARIYAESKQLFQQVLALDPAFGDAYLQLALIAIVHDRELKQAQEYFIQAIARNPAEITAHLRYAELLLALRDFPQAAHHNKIAQSLDPHYYASASIVWVYNMAGQYAEAKQELAKLYSLEPDSLISHSSALRLYENMGDEATAFKHYLLAFAAAGYSEAELAEARAVFAQGGLSQLNFWLAEIKNEQRDIGQYHPPISTARYFAAAGDAGRALDYLELAYAQDDYLLLWLSSDPKYLPLHGLPRFTRLLKNVGLE